MRTDTQTVRKNTHGLAPQTGLLERLTRALAGRPKRVRKASRIRWEDMNPAAAAELSRLDRLNGMVD